MRSVAFLALFFVTLTSFYSCSEKTFREDKVFAGNIYVEAKTLNYGKQIYTEYCMACHGVAGDGKGVAAKGMVVPPRDFRTGVIKFGDVVSGEIPHDASIMKLIREGLNGTAMLPWDLTQSQLYAVTQYIKTFAPNVWEGKDKKLGEKVELTKDPYGDAHKTAALEKGREVYHFVANCQSCHRAYASHEELSAISEKRDGKKMTEFDEDLYKPKPQFYEWGTQVTPPDFTYHKLRSVKTVEDLYLRLAAGVGGGVMPSWKGVIEDDEIWAVAHYVKSLMDLSEDKEGKKALYKKLENK